MHTDFRNNYCTVFEINVCIPLEPSEFSGVCIKETVSKISVISCRFLWKVFRLLLIIRLTTCNYICLWCCFSPSFSGLFANADKVR